MLAASVDRPSISTELNSTETIKLTLSGSGGFTGDVTVAAAVTDGSGAPLTGWTVTLDSSSFTFSADGDQIATATLKIPSLNMGLVGNVNFTVTSSLGMVPVTSAVTVNNQVTFAITASGTQCAYPSAATVHMSVGSKIVWMNMTNFTLVVHVGSVGGSTNTTGVSHQDLAGSTPNAAYTQTISGADSSGIEWYCHSPGPTVSTNVIITQ